MKNFHSLPQWLGSSFPSKIPSGSVVGGLVLGMIGILGAMPPLVQAQVSQNVITTQAANAQSLAVADLDGDGDADLLSASVKDGKIAWYENRFGESGADGDGFGDQRVITVAEGAKFVAAADLNGDEAPDVISASSGDNAKIAWYENQVGERGPEDDGFGDQQTIATSIQFQMVAPADLDGDGDPDLLSASNRSVRTYENQIGESGTDDDGFGDAQVITDNNVDDVKSVAAADLDGDDDQDVLSASYGDGKIAWYENRLGESGADDDGFGDQQSLTARLEGAKFVAAADVDADGDPDVLSASSKLMGGKDQIALFENQIGEKGADADGFGDHQTITTSAKGANTVTSADLDGDGDPDLLSSSFSDKKIAWYENQHGESGADEDGFGPQQRIATSAKSTAFVTAADVDGDGDPDVLSAFGDTIAWVENSLDEGNSFGP